ncbi:aminodeoxychorismate/anthranilate synthase component II [Virgibacillus halodenitrificans]|uniref:anthranilate synthase component II n=1 Tax=Virgibacillus halodenitrificans TaxID=1482 RepID=UPI001F2E6BF5|nr:aminodeoxychorismate/anthranilate synthase component II [Virgibacillus halodenitrificans]MCG1028095.1 aminodeoxychorismate/anthranilate synthase component II [Virgibacillus halodenitrificans]
MIFVIDNYDSFTHNIVQYLKQLDLEIRIKRNDEITIKEIEEMEPSHILISPGPGCPDQAGICLEVVEHFYKQLPIFGVCLGHQVIAQAFGASVIKAEQPMHGKVSSIQHDGKGIFQGLNNPLTVTRYHSLVVDTTTVPDCLHLTARTNKGEIMALRHSLYPIESIQSHPEAILTEQGLEIFKNFFKKKEVPMNGSPALF